MADNYMAQYYIGMMSGTSLDGIDAVLATVVQGKWSVVHHIAYDMPVTLKDRLYSLNFASNNTANELHLAKTAEYELTQCYAAAVQQLLQSAEVSVEKVVAIGAHGQTIRHEPNLPKPYTVQLLNGAQLSHLTQQTVVCDFRSKDVAAGGQGAPLAPLFHQALFDYECPYAVVNIGGISNISLINNSSLSGFDCGPGNCLLDEWMIEHQQQPFDKDGKWAANGQVIPELLARLYSDAYFSILPPKSTGRDYFNRQWLNQYLSGDEQPVDVMRTLVRLTAQCISDHAKDVHTLVLAGGGANNALLCEDINTLLSAQAIQIHHASDVGIDVQHLEALGFAWLARQAIEKQRLITTAITGAKKPVMLGAINYY